MFVDLEVLKISQTFVFEAILDENSCYDGLYVFLYSMEFTTKVRFGSVPEKSFYTCEMFT